MPLPRAVQEQADAADALMAGFENPNAPAVDPETGLPVAAPEVADVADAAPAPPPAAAPAPAPQEPAAEEWKHKYFTLKGMFDAEVPRLNTQVKTLSAQVQELANRPAPAAAPAVPAQLITDQDRESFGADLVGLIERGTQQAVAPLQAQLDAALAENAQLKQQVGQVSQSQAQNAEQVFFGKLGAQIQELEKKNGDAGFLAWLNEVDPIYGLPRKVALDNAVSVKDVVRTANIFNSYFTAKPVPPAPAPNPLAKQVTPARTRASAEPVAPQTIAWTHQLIEQFYAMQRQGAIPTDEAARLEADLQAAVAEGRVR